MIWNIRIFKEELRLLVCKHAKDYQKLMLLKIKMVLKIKEHRIESAIINLKQDIHDNPSSDVEKMKKILDTCEEKLEKWSDK